MTTTIRQRAAEAASVLALVASVTTLLVPKDLPDGYLEVHTFTVDSSGILYGGDNQYGRTQKFEPKRGADPALLIRPPWAAHAHQEPLAVGAGRVPHGEVRVRTHQSARSMTRACMPADFLGAGASCIATLRE